MTCMLHLCFQTGTPTDSPSPSSSKSTSALDMLTTSDLITTLANFSHTGNTARMVHDGACGALVSLVQEFRGTNKSQNGRISCALRNLTCYLGNAQRMESDGVIEALLVRNYIFFLYCVLIIMIINGIEQPTYIYIFFVMSLFGHFQELSIDSNLDVQQHCLCALCNLAGESSISMYYIFFSLPIFMYQYSPSC